MSNSFVHSLTPSTPVAVRVAYFSASDGAYSHTDYVDAESVDAAHDVAEVIRWAVSNDDTSEYSVTAEVVTTRSYADNNN